MKDFIASLSENGVEGELLRTMFIALGLSLAVLFAAHYFLSNLVPDLLARYGYSLLFSALSFSLLLPSVRQIRAYKTFQCMSGMMIGMTLGMIAGFLIGFFVGATNGMFWGGLAGMAFGIAIGTTCGSCCGIMGFLEGIMAGFMGGLMGAMTAVMLFNDNLKAGGIIFFIISAVIAFSLNLMVYREMKGMKRAQKDSDIAIAFISVILMLATIAIVVFGPRGVIFQ